MRIIYTSVRAASHADDRLARFHRVLYAAQQTSRYLPFLERANLHERHAIAGVTCITAALSRLPAINGNEFRNIPGAFCNPRGRATAKREFLYPLGNKLRTTIILPDRNVEGFAASSGLQILKEDWRHKLERCDAATLAAPVDVLREIGIAMARGELVRRAPTNAVVAFTGIHHGSLTAAHRELLWNLFQVPVFEQYLGFDGRLAAWECEAHDGLHLLPDEVVMEESGGVGSELLITSLTNLQYPALRLSTGLYGALASGYCECGKSTEKLYTVRPSGADVCHEMAVA